MQHEKILAGIIIVALLFGGCVTPDDTDHEPEVNGENEAFDGFPPPRDGSIQLPHALYPTFQGRGCETVSMSPIVPWDELREHVPADFRLMGPVPGVLARVTFLVDRCSDTLDNATIFGETHMVIARASVIPVNESWSKENLPHAYLLDVATDNPDWMDSLKRAHLPSESATFSFTKQEILGDTFTVDIDIEGEDWEVSASFLNVENDPSSRDYQLHLWYGEGPYHRITESASYDHIGITGQGFFIHEGDTTLASSNPSPIFPYEFGSWRFNKNVLFQYDGAWEYEP